MTTMSKGSNIPVPFTSLRAVVTWRTGGAPDVDVSALLLDDGGKVRGEDDFVFYNQPSHPSGAVAHAGKQQGADGTATDAIRVDLSRVPAGVERIVIGASADGGTFGQVPGLSLKLLDEAGREHAVFDITDATTETAYLFGELYLRNGAWKFRAVGQGYASGLAGLATDFGIAVEEEPPPAAVPLNPPAPQAPPAPTYTPPTLPPSAVQTAPNQAVRTMPTAPTLQPPAPAAPPQPAPASAPAAQGTGAPVSLKKQKLVNMEKRLADQGHPRLLSLTKQAAVSLEKRGLGEHTARVALCLDISASMNQLFQSGKVQALIERVLSLGLRFDDNGEVDVFLFGANGHEAGTLGLGQYQGWTDMILRKYPLEGGTDYAAAMRLVRENYFKTSAPRHGPVADRLPVYVMFITDGMTTSQDATRQQVVHSSYEPLFWQFMGIGPSPKAVDKQDPAAAGGAPAPKKKGKLSERLANKLIEKLGGGFAFLEELDDLQGRYTDNAAFFAVTDPANLTDEQLFDLMMEEYPDWLNRARSMGLLLP
ncbi:VWA domain-containing protein [Yinghuangia seranimata]|uniref:VWA domain-containing protein n=1 Tax=Yinghuangia seranimata TaxID=408067 RepID=UPI00248BFCB9|nr:VWA domain-containing protein [Yinghuangia seranimata]MDI2129978.1 VWA domain-containing protein [Yinghuangia seranimata]